MDHQQNFSALLSKVILHKVEIIAAVVTKALMMTIIGTYILYINWSLITP